MIKKRWQNVFVIRYSAVSVGLWQVIVSCWCDVLYFFVHRERGSCYGHLIFYYCDF